MLVKYGGSRLYNVQDEVKWRIRELDGSGVMWKAMREAEMSY